MKVVRYKLSWSIEWGDFIYVAYARLDVLRHLGMRDKLLVHPDLRYFYKVNPAPR